MYGHIMAHNRFAMAETSPPLNQGRVLTTVDAITCNYLERSKLLDQVSGDTNWLPGFILAL